MSKNVVFCADGTWSGPNQPDNDDTSNPTNVLKLFENLDGGDTHETASQSGKERERSLEAADRSIRQIAKYLHGVGDSENFLVRVLGGALGAGLITRIVRGYTFLSRSWATGDRIFIIGFSRGAYTARALADLVAAKGLLDATKLDLTDKTGAYRLGAAVWYQYQRDRLLGNPSLLGELEDVVLDLPGFLTHPPSANQLVAAPIAAVAVWDTVGALGIPEFNVKGMRVDSLQFIDRKLSAEVSRGLHAVAIDEKRADFTPTLWDADPRITQMLFAGAHDDVGGGYPETNDESGLSDGALAWMIGELARLGVDFSVPPAHPEHPDARGMAHRPWIHPPWTVLLQDTRPFPDHGLVVSPTVRDRMAAGDVPVEGESASLYRPSNLPGLIA
jgi:uncharacterized protein (DUF2235 family)